MWTYAAGILGCAAVQAWRSEWWWTFFLAWMATGTIGDIRRDMREWPKFTE
jgi:hypothetical protein